MSSAAQSAAARPAAGPQKTALMEREQASAFLYDLLRLMIAKDGSDLFLTVDFPPAFKISGKMVPVSDKPLTTQHTIELARALMNDRQAAEFEANKELNFAISPGGIGRFRVNAFTQMGRTGLVLRVIKSEIPDLATLNLPPVMSELSMTQRGLILMVGATGSGKSSLTNALTGTEVSQAARIRPTMIGHRNEHSHGHIITIEDPVEFVHVHKNCIVTHREVGVDTLDWHVALKNTLRQAPDVIMLGEIRDRETMEHAVAFAETGHLCMGTLHANSANQALDRIINFFPDERRQQLLMDLSLNLKAVISQRLVPAEGRKGRVAAVEIMINSPLISDLIFKGSVSEIKEIMKKSRELGMQTFDQHLFDLFEAGQISYENALRNADSVNDLRLNIKLNSKRRSEDPTAASTKLGIV